MAAKIEHPYYPIIYLRGYAMTQGAIEETVATPYMGFNLGSTKVRQAWDGEVLKHIFESPLVRLMKDYQYEDTFKDGKERDDALPARSVIIHRYYEQGDRDLGTGDRPTIIGAAKELGELVERVRDQVCGDDAEARAAFRVYLVAHSMGGLVCRCFLQNPAVSTPEVKRLVDKVFTYGTPHNGIELRGLHVPGWLGIWDANTFNRGEIAKFLDLTPNDGRVDSLGTSFDPAYFFSLVGTNHKDYNATRWAVGPRSDGLVKIANAAVAGGPRAYVHRAHSGHYGLVNSEEGYQNLTRFLFGDTFVRATLELENLPLPPPIQKKYDAGREIRASYLFEATVTPRGAFDFNLTERRVDDCSAAFRTFDELFRLENTPFDTPRSPCLFTVFLDSKQIFQHPKATTQKRPINFKVDLQVRTTDYVVRPRGRERAEIHPAEHIYRERLTFEATRTDEGWRLHCIREDKKIRREVDIVDGVAFVDLESQLGFKAKLRLEVGAWNREART